nr:salt stress-like protein [Tamarix hispida]
MAANSRLLPTSKPDGLMFHGKQYHGSTAQRAGRMIQCSRSGGGGGGENKMRNFSANSRRRVRMSPAVVVKVALVESRDAVCTRTAEIGIGIADVSRVWVGVVLRILKRLQGGAIQKPTKSRVQMYIESAIVNCRFFTFLAIAGSLLGSVLCFVEGCVIVLQSYFHYFHAVSQSVDPGHAIKLIIEAIDMFLVGIAMLIFGTGLYAMFVGSKNLQGTRDRGRLRLPKSSLFGLFPLKMLPSWLEMDSVSRAKSRIGHAVMMILQVGVLDKFKSIPLVTGLDLACFAAAVFISSFSIFLLSKLYYVPPSKLINMVE